MRVLILARQPLISEGLKNILKRLSPDAEVSNLLIDEHTRAELASSLEPKSLLAEADLVVLEIVQPLEPGDLQIVNQLLRNPARKVVVFCSRPNASDIRTLMDTGLHGVISSDAPLSSIENVLRLILDGEIYVNPIILKPDRLNETATPFKYEMTSPETMSRIACLTRRQRQVLDELGIGLSNAEIGAKLGIAEATVKLHVNAILKQLGVKNRTRAAHYAQYLNHLT